MEGWLENKNMSLEVNVYNVIAIAATEALVSYSYSRGTKHPFAANNESV